MNVYWFEQNEADLPSDNDWLSAPETLRFNQLRIPKRRADWRLGRWTAKRAIACHLKLPVDSRGLQSIEIRPAPDGAPELIIDHEPASFTLSLSHCSGTAVCAIAGSAAALGCDLEIIEPRSDVFVAGYFTSEEQSRIASASNADRSGLATLLWSCKESALKALRMGLRLDTRSVSVRLGSPIHHPVWQPVRVVYDGGETFDGWWQSRDNHVRTMVAVPSPAQPILLTNVTPDRSGASHTRATA